MSPDRMEICQSIVSEDNTNTAAYNSLNSLSKGGNTKFASTGSHYLQKCLTLPGCRRIHIKKKKDEKTDPTIMAEYRRTK